MTADQLALDLVGKPGSPFDTIRQTRPDGSEFWSARDLMAAMRYDQWRNFETAIHKARASAENQGYAAGDHIADASKMVDVGSGARRTVDDWHLTRFGAYLVVMNGDPRKSEIAAAQGYFAVKTREAEVRQELDEIEVAERYLAALREKKALEAQAAIDAPLVAQAEVFREADGYRTIPDLANDLQVHAASNYQGIKVLHQDVFDLAGRIDLVIRGNTVRNNQPTSRAIAAGWVRAKETVYRDSKGQTHLAIGTRLTPKGYGRLWDAAIRNLREHGTVLPNIKEITA